MPPALPARVHAPGRAPRRAAARSAHHLRALLVAGLGQVDLHDAAHHRRGRRQHDHPVAEVHRLVHVVGDDHHRDAELVAQGQHQVLQVHAGLGVHGGEGLVHQQQLRLIGERPGNRDALLHAARQFAGMCLAAAGESHRVQGTECQRAGTGPVDALGAQRQRHVAGDRQPRQQRASVVLEHQPHLLGRLPRHRLAGHLHASGARAQQPGDDAQHGGLAGARGPDDRHHLAACHVEVDAGQGNVVALVGYIGLLDSLNLHNGFGHDVSCRFAAGSRRRCVSRRSAARKPRLSTMPSAASSTMPAHICA